MLYLREKPVIAITKACLQRLHLLSTFRHGSPSRALSPNEVNVRVFLAAYMIVHRPTHVFETMGKLETELLGAATPMLAAFEQMCNQVHAEKEFGKVPPQMTKDFPTLLFQYLRAFKAWKVSAHSVLPSLRSLPNTFLCLTGPRRGQAHLPHQARPQRAVPRAGEDARGRAR